MLIFYIFLNSIAHISSWIKNKINQVSKIITLIKVVKVALVMSQPGLWSNSMHFQVLILTSPMSEKSMKSYWQAFSYARDSIYEAFFHLGSVPLESTVTDALEYYICKLSWLLSSRLWCLTVSLLPWVRCGTWLYRILIFAVFLSLF